MNLTEKSELNNPYKCGSPWATLAGKLDRIVFNMPPIIGVKKAGNL